MSPLLLAAVILVLVIAIAAVLHRRHELGTGVSRRNELAAAVERGSHRARLQHPHIDTRTCIGCGTCVTACPEEGVLDLIHGQAVVIHGSRCVGHGRCADACGVGAISLTLGDVSDRRDLPALDEGLEAVGVPGLFLAGEIGGQALVRTAVAQGTAVARTVAARTVAARIRQAAPARRRAVPALVHHGGTAARPGEPESEAELDLLIVGTGPGGMACALQAQELGLRYLAIEQAAEIGGAVAAYPRRKLVMTQPMTLPLHGRLKQLSYAKEELVGLWRTLHERHNLPIRTETTLQRIRREEPVSSTVDGGLTAQAGFAVETDRGTFRARHVCLALGRRGTPRRLDVPGEDLPKVAYSLADAQSYRDRHILVVGGGDSAVEAALGLALQPGNVVTLAYRKAAFFRLKARNESRIERAIAAGEIRVLFRCRVSTIHQTDVELVVDGADGSRALLVRNDEVFVFAGGTPPFGLLEDAGVSFDPKDRPPPVPPAERGTGLLGALVFTLVAALALAGWVLWHGEYYELDPGLRPESPLHRQLGPKSGLGLLCGGLAVVLFACNLCYLWRRGRLGRWLPGSLRSWMSMHVGTGLLAFLLVLLHSGLAPQRTAGGHAFLALAVVVATGSIGRYLYSFVPRAVSGATLDLDTLRTKLAALAGEWDREGGGFGTDVRRAVEQLAAESTWRAGFFARISGLLRSQLALRRRLGELRERGRAEGIPRREVRRMLALAHRAHRLALMASHYDELRALLSSWRYFHRWLALLMVLLTGIHVAAAVRFGEIDWSRLTLLFGGGP